MTSTLFLDTDGPIDAAVANGYFPPVADGILAYYEFGASLEQSLKNLVQPSLPAIAVGSVSAVENGINLNGRTAYLNTQIVPGADWTIFVVVKSLVDLMLPLENVAVASAEGSGPSSGFYLPVNAPSPAAPPTGLMQSYVAYAGNNFVQMDGVTSATMPDASVYNLLLYKCTSGVGHKIRNFTVGASLSRGVTATPVPAVNPLLIGARSSAGAEADSRQKRFAFYNRALSTSEEDIMAAFIRADLAALASPIIV